MGRREYYNRVGWRKYLDVKHSPRVKLFLQINGLIIFNQLLGNMEEAIAEKVNEILLLVHRNARAIVSIQQKDYREVLEYSMNWFLENEHYEQCARVQLLLDNLNTKKIKSKKKKVDVIE